MPHRPYAVVDTAYCFGVLVGEETASCDGTRRRTLILSINMACSEQHLLTFDPVMADAHNIMDRVSIMDRMSTPPPTQLEPNAHPPAKETPYKLRITDSPAYRFANLAQRRKTILEELSGMVAEVEVDWFFGNVLPNPIEGFDPVAVVEALKDNGAITDSGWHAFPSDPKTDHRHEDQVYGQLALVFDAVIQATKALHPEHTQHFSLVLLPTVAPFSERASRAPPDATFCPKAEVPYSWYHLATPGEFKKDPESCRAKRNENVAQTIGNLQHIMTVDPRRRFSFGWTIQDRDLRLWFACRGAVLVTKTVDVFTNPSQLVCFFTSMAYSSTTALGWDTSIQHLPDSSAPRQYTITVKGQTFTTVKILADYFADSLVSRATRVWLVKDEKDKQFVLKDVWMDSDRYAEDEICARLLKDVLRRRGQEDHDTLKRHILMPHVFERLKIGKKDDVTYCMMNNQTPSAPKVFNLEIPTSTDPKSLSVHPSNSISLAHLSRPSRPANDQSQSTKPVIRSRYHYRVVFKEYGTDLYSEMSLVNVFKTLSDLVNGALLLPSISSDMLTIPTALEIVHDSGWVHRDISCGNVYWLPNPNEGVSRGILGDFEYAKQCEDGIEHERRTGTSEFMAFEAANRKYRKLNPAKASLEKKDIQKPAKFAHNPLHDLESVWWMLVHVVLHRDCQGQSASDQELRDDKVKALFQDGPRSAGREELIDEPWNFTLETTGVFSSFKPVLDVAQELGQKLLFAYIAAEEAYTFIGLEKCMIHGDFCSPLIIEENLEAIKSLKLVPVAAAKRKAVYEKNDVLDKRQSKRSKGISNTS
ncbi:hypothetical protein D9757_008604 [Collybiopsis confluens]|uniref:Fungal-type protein kinase domain-containing protein n=1 Tax=Collybiopsis confluens TaxID=2823264 RepID=A0A8H5HND6_9AGAR|nr:hypothetical protein D9757_008604 [Collybiopsis confluens]